MKKLILFLLLNALFIRKNFSSSILKKNINNDTFFAKIIKNISLKEKIKKIYKEHPIIGSKITYDIISSIVIIIEPIFFCSCNLSKINHLKQQSKNIFYIGPKNFFNYCFYYNKEKNNKKNFFSNKFITENGNQFSLLKKLLFFPLLTFSKVILDKIRN